MRKQEPKLTERERDNRYADLRNIGCISCRINEYTDMRPTGLHVEIHHLNEGGHAGSKRRGDRYTVPLCIYHHRNVGIINGGVVFNESVYGPSLAGNPKKFRQVYGSDDRLLEIVDQRIKWIKWG